MKAGYWIHGASALAMVAFGQSAWAQDAQPPVAADQAVPTEAQSAQTDNASQEIVVTATRRRENLMRTSVAASVLTGEDLANKGVTNVDALQFASPSITVNNFGQGNDFNIRGIGKAEHNTQTTTGVITYRDGVPSFPGYFTGEPYYDIDNIQVLRGPQGTIVGQNATGGAVFLNTKDPVLGKTEGYIQGQVGNYADFGAQGAFNLPLSDTFAARLSYNFERRNGFYDISGPGGSDYRGNNGDLYILSGRLGMLWEPSANFSILSKTDVNYLDFGAYPANPFYQSFKKLPNGSANPTYTDLFDISANAPGNARDKFIRSILRMEYKTDGGTRFRSVSSYQKGNTTYGGDLDGTSSDFKNPITGAAPLNRYFYDNLDERQLTQEFNIISPDSKRLTWLAGVFGVWNKYYFLPPFSNFTIDLAYPSSGVATQYNLKGTNPTRSVAAFGQIGYQITPSLSLELGGRYTASRSTNHVDVRQYGTPIRTDLSTKSDNFSYKVSLGWQASQSQYFYGFVATGFRPGGLNVPVGFGDPDPFTEETVQSFEAGWKGSFLNNHLRLTSAAFLNRYKDFQVTIGYPLLPVFGIEVNVPGTTKIYGVEAEAQLRLGRLSFDAGVSAIHSRIAEFYATDSRVAALAPCDPEKGPVSASCIDLGGKEQTYAPNFTFNVGASYEIPLGNGDTLTPRANYGHVAAQWATLFENENLGDRLKARNTLNAQLAWQHGDLTVTAYGTNLTDQHYPAALNSGLYFAGAPRQFGLRARKAF